MCVGVMKVNFVVSIYDSVEDRDITLTYTESVNWPVVPRPGEGVEVPGSGRPMVSLGAYRVEDVIYALDGAVTVRLFIGTRTQQAESESIAADTIQAFKMNRWIEPPDPQPLTITTWLRR
jgi:hypothetical protein